MEKVYRARARPLLVAAMVGLGLMASQQVQAQAIVFQGYTMGCFGGGCVPVGGTVNTPPGLSYTANANWQGALGVGGFPNNWGVFALTNANAVYNTSFTLGIYFNVPTNEEIFVAAVTGQTLVNDLGAVVIDFDNNWVNWSDDEGNYAVRVEDVVVQEGQTDAEVRGELRSSTVPEPISMVLLGSGLLGLGVVRRRRTRYDQAD